MRTWSRSSAAGMGRGVREAMKPGQLSFISGGFAGVGAAPCADAWPANASHANGTAARSLSDAPCMSLPRNGETNLARFGRARYGARAFAGSVDVTALAYGAVTHRGDHALRGHHRPAAVLPLDLLDAAEAGKLRADGHLEHAAVALHIDVAVIDIDDAPAVQHRRRSRRRFNRGDALRRLRQRHRRGRHRHGLRRGDGAGDLGAVTRELVADLGDLRV